MQLFRDEVYDLMQQRISGRSDFAGVEEALYMINHDERLQSFIHEHAKKNGISCRGWGDYGHGSYACNNLVRYEIIFWEGKPQDSSQPKHKPTLKLCPDLGKNIAPIFLNFYKWGDSWCGRSHFYECLLVEERDGAFYTLVDPYKIESVEAARERGHVNHDWSRMVERYHNQRILHVGFLEGVTMRDLLDGLERAMQNVLKNS